MMFAFLQGVFPILLGLLVLVCIALAGVVLLQRSEGGALGMGGGPSGFMSTRGAGDLLTRTTWILGGVLFVLCLSLTVIQAQLHKGSSVTNRVTVAPGAAPILQVAPPTPATPTAPPATGFEAPTPQVHAGAGAAPGAVQLPPDAGSGAPDPFAAPAARVPAQRSAPAPKKP